MRGWDYRSPGVYAITVCVEGRLCCLGDVVDGQAVRSRLGEIAAEEWLRIAAVHSHVALDEWIIMPDHMHGILVFQGQPGPIRPGLLTPGSLGAVVGQFKERATKRIRARRSPWFTWQERFFDQILRDDDALEHYRLYIRENPIHWTPP